MDSPHKRYVIVFNGEIYNHRQLRPELETAGCTFRGHSDTEVLLAAIEHWGIEKSLARLNGMFAFALWDRRERALVLARDRIGIKPLYFGWIGNSFVFGSELKAFASDPEFTNPVDRDSLALLLELGYIPAPHSIYRDILKLPPGCWLRVDRELASQPQSPRNLASRMTAYWSAPQEFEDGVLHPLDLSDREAIEQMERLLSDSVALRMEADVPLGAFLSGGVDSSTVVALMQKQSSRPVKTFSIGFREDTYDEAGHARNVAKYLGTEHHELYVSPEDALEVVPELPEMFDEPLADPAQIPTYLVSRLARSMVKVSLSGDGGDELFGGYSRYYEAARLWHWLCPIPQPIRNATARLLGHQGMGTNSLVERLVRNLPERLRPRNPSQAASTLAGMLACRSSDELYHRIVSRWHRASGMVPGSRHVPTAVSGHPPPGLPHPIERMMATDFCSYLPDDCLAKVDRASMAASLEARVPMLDHRVAEFAWRVPMNQKVRNGKGKWLLRKVLHRHVPESLVERPKMGFGVPVSEWLRGPLREWAENLLDERRLRQEGYFEPEPIRQAWKQHIEGKGNEPHKLWTVLMFQSWLEHSRIKETTRPTST